MKRRANAVVIGAGIGGVSTTFHLAVREGLTDVLMVDPLQPLTLTSDKSTECYRNWWPNKPMVGLMNRSIDLLEEMNDEPSAAFALSKRGYLYVSSDTERLQAMLDQTRVTSEFSAGPVRQHPGPEPYGEADDGVDILGPAGLREHFPYITDTAVGAVHVRRAGWFSAHQLGSWMLDQARMRGAELLAAEVIDIHVESEQIVGVSLSDGSTIATNTVIAAAGPMSAPVASLAGVELPLYSELHLKVSFKDHLGVIPRQAPMVIWSDPQQIAWGDDQRQELARMGRTDVLGEMPIYCHGRPEGGEESPYFVALWEYHHEILEPTWPLPDDPLYPEVVMRGLTTMVPGLAPYLDGLPESTVDGGYYTKTRENRPLIGPCGPQGFHVVAGLSGFGVMIAAGAGDLMAGHVTGRKLPDYADSFLLSRYDDPNYMTEIGALEDSGQL